IERIATEYSASEFLLCARVLCGDITTVDVGQQEVEAALDMFDPVTLPEGANADINPDLNEFLRDPGISEEQWAWLQNRAAGSFASLIAKGEVFSHYESQRKVPLMFVLNVMCTVLGGYYGRNSKVKEYLEDYTANFGQSQALIDKLNS